MNFQQKKLNFIKISYYFFTLTKIMGKMSSVEKNGEKKNEEVDIQWGLVPPASSLKCSLCLKELRVLFAFDYPVSCICG